MIDKYPIENHNYSPFPDSVPMFCFPEGVKFKREDSQVTSYNFVLT